MKQFIFYSVAFLLACSAHQTSQTDPFDHGYIDIPIEKRYVYLFCPVKINGVDATFFIDTGAPFTVINKNFIDRLKIKVEETGKQRGLGGEIDTYLVKLQKLSLSKLDITDFLTFSFDMADIISVIGPIDGILGADILYYFNMRLSFKDNLLRISAIKRQLLDIDLVQFASEPLLESRNKAGLIQRMGLNLSFETNSGHKTFKLFFDSGSAGDITLGLSAYKALGKPDLQILPNIFGRGVGGLLNNHHIAFKTIQTKNISYGMGIASFVKSDAFGIVDLDDWDGFIGQQILRFHDLLIHHDTNKVYLTPLDKSYKPVDRLLYSVILDKFVPPDRLEVGACVDADFCKKHAIEIGDNILKLDHHDILPLIKVKELMDSKEEGEEILYEMETKSGIISVSVPVKDMAVPFSE